MQAHYKPGFFKAGDAWVTVCQNESTYQTVMFFVTCCKFLAKKRLQGGHRHPSSHLTHSLIIIEPMRTLEARSLDLCL